MPKFFFFENGIKERERAKTLKTFSPHGVKIYLFLLIVKYSQTSYNMNS